MPNIFWIFFQKWPLSLSKMQTARPVPYCLLADTIANCDFGFIAKTITFVFIALFFLSFSHNEVLVHTSLTNWLKYSFECIFVWICLFVLREEEWVSLIEFSITSHSPTRTLSKLYIANIRNVWCKKRIHICYCISTIANVY